MPIAMDGALWMDGSTVSLQLVAPSGLLYSVELPLVVLMAQLDDGEIVRFTYDRADPETGVMHSGAARLVLQHLPDPREEEGPPCGRCGAPADAHVAWASGHLYVAAEGTEEPVNVPVRRQVDGKWQTVMITRSEWERTRTEEQPPAADATVKSVGPSFRDSGGFPVLPPYTPPAP